MRGLKGPSAGLLLLWLAPLTGAVGQRPEYDPHRITALDIQTNEGLRTALDAVRALRPRFLRTRPSGSVQNQDPVPIAVYVNGTRRGGIEALDQILARAVIEIRWLSGNDATTRFGTNHESGAILVTEGAVYRPPD
jgi:hypothetical protein